MKTPKFPSRWIFKARVPTLIFSILVAGWNVLARDFAGISTSQQMPDPIHQLPILGNIDWTVAHIPHVRPGPSDGISGMGMVVYGGMIYLMGGFIPFGDGEADARGKPGSHRTSRWAHRYEPEAKSWTQLPDMPGRREYCRAISTDNGVYLLGGACQFAGQSEYYRPFADCFRLDLSHEAPKWTTHSNFAVPRTHMAVGMIDGKLLVVAGGNEYNIAVKGYHKSTVRDTTEVFDLSRPDQGWQLRKPLPKPRGWTASAVCQDRFYVMGGITYSDSNIQHRHKENYRYDAAKDEWETITSFVLPISGWEGATFKDRYVIAIGGVLLPEDRPIKDYTDELIKNTRWNDIPFVYDTQEDRWYRLQGALPPRGKFNDAGVCIIGDTIYVAGAEGPSGGHYNHFLIGRIEMAADVGGP